jgi:hypothetical protein
MSTNVTSTPTVQTNILKAFVNASSLGSNAVVSAVNGKSIRVTGVALVTTLANSVKFLSAATDISATFPLGANGGIVLPFNEHGWFQTNSGEALNLNLSVATSTGLSITYVVI